MKPVTETFQGTMEVGVLRNELFDLDERFRDPFEPLSG